MSTAKIVVWSLLVLALALVSYFAGTSLGYDRGYAIGYAYHGFSNSSTNAYVTLSTIETLRARKTASAKEDLEQRLDTEIVEHWAGIVNLPADAFIPTRQDEESVRKLMGKVAAYRKKRPTRATDPAVRSAIEEVVARYSDSTAPARQKRPGR
jgi:hypothetical protein